MFRMYRFIPLKHSYHTRRDSTPFAKRSHMRYIIRHCRILARPSHFRSTSAPASLSHFGGRKMEGRSGFLSRGPLIFSGQIRASTIEAGTCVVSHGYPGLDPDLDLEMFRFFSWGASMSDYFADAKRAETGTACKSFPNGTTSLPV